MFVSIWKIFYHTVFNFACSKKIVQAYGKRQAFTAYVFFSGSKLSDDNHDFEPNLLKKLKLCQKYWAFWMKLPHSG